MPLTILYIFIRFPCSLVSCKVDSPISFNHSSYVRSFSNSTIFVAIFCICSNLLRPNHCCIFQLWTYACDDFFHHIFVHELKCHSYVSQHFI
ncbi:hypothetical protein E2C01_001219 [Portunus trituberculatus]|uniref:Uncharacterized protein n=1 Tax=Portunus trituberculatus TaxID=210409 RepID=A0A5B7CH33_PORTR|nr:hypothetical protein [Portunus trituberculatus]